MAFELSGSVIIDQHRQLLSVGVITATSLDVSGDVDVDGTLEADAITVAGSTLASVIEGTTVTNATNAANVAITDDTTGSGTHYLHFGSATSSNDGIEVDSTGLVYKDGDFGIGTDDPDGKLTIGADGALAQLELRRTNANTTGAIGAINWTASDTHSVANIYALGDGDNEGAHLIFKTTSAAAENNPYGTATEERLRIRSGGEVAIGGQGYAGQPFSVQTSSTNLGYMQSTGTTRAVMAFVDGNSTVNVGFGAIGDNHVFMKDAVEKVRIDSLGNVGIGYTRASNFLAGANNLVVGSGSGDEGITIYSGSSASNYGSIYFADGTSGAALNRGMIRYEQNNEVMSFHTNNNERLRITLAGDVGIGTVTPTARLDVRRGDADGKIAEFHQSTGYGIDIGSSQAAAYISSGYGQSFIFKTNAGSGQVERLRITSGGLVGIKTDVMFNGALLSIGNGQGANTPSGEHIKIAPSANTITFLDSASNASDTGNVQLWNTVYNNSSAKIELYHPAANTGGIKLHTHDGTSLKERLRILSNGRVGINSTVPTTPLNVQAETSTGVCLRLNQEPTYQKSYIQFQDYATTGSDSWIMNEGTDLTVYAGYGGKLHLGAYDTTGITVLSTGKVGIGTDNPSTAMHLLASDSYFTMQSSSASGNAGILFKDSSGTQNAVIFYDFDNDYLKISTNDDTERLRITSGGNTQFWGTRAGALQPEDADNLQIYTKSADNSINRGSGITFYNHDNSGYEMGGTIQVAKENGTADNEAAYMRFSTRPAGAAALERLRIHSNGHIGIGDDITNDTAFLKVIAADGEADDQYAMQLHNEEATDGRSWGLSIRAGSNSTDHGFLVADHDNANKQFMVRGDGKVGIATDNPQQMLDVNGNAVIGHRQVTGNPGTTVGIATIRGHHVNSNSEYSELYFANSESAGGSTASIRAGRWGDNTGTNLSFWTHDYGSGSDGNGNERLRIDSSGRLLLGHTQYLDISSYKSNLQVVGTDADGSSLVVSRFSDDASSSSIHLTKSRATSKGSHTNGDLHDDDGVGNIFWWGSDGSEYEEVARIGVEAEAAFTGSSTPGNLTFWTTASGATTATERLRIGPSGQLGIGGANYGTDGQVLTSTGSGSAPAWEDASGGGGGGGSSVWVSNDTGIHTTSNVGIATTTASAVLEIGSTGVTTATTVINAQAWDGQVFNVDGNITSDSIFAVNDISGLPVLDFNATHGNIAIAPFGNNVSIGYTNAGTKLGLKGSTSERVYIVADELSDQTSDTINIDNGNVQYFTTAEDGGTLTANITSNNGINNDLAIGDSTTVVVIIKPDSSSDKITNITIDGSAVTEEWLGGEAPNGGASNTYDVYTFFILKTADATFLPLCNKVNFA